MTFPPPPGPPNQPPPPPQPGQPPYAQPNPQFAPYGQQPAYPAAQAPYGQPVQSWQAPQPVAPAPAAGRGWVVPAVVVASLVTIGGVFAASAAGDGDGSPVADEARDAVVRLVDAMAEGDCAGVEAASTGGYFRSMNLTCEDIAGNGQWMNEAGVSFVIGEADVSGDTADVPVDIVVTSDPTQNGSGWFTVVRTGDSWRVSNDQMS